MPSKSFPADLDHLPEIFSWIRSILEDTLLEKEEILRMELALEEAIVNIIHHAKPEHFDLDVRYTPGKQIEFDLMDSGPPFNPLIHPIEEKEVSLEEQKPGGKGLVLIRKCTDALLYRREKEKNVLTLIKKI